VKARVPEETSAGGGEIPKATLRITHILPIANEGSEESRSQRCSLNESEAP
jgi:hypothetical protein